eukprot:4640314-Ditylum_brightwellii.AAC.1
MVMHPFEGDSAALAITFYVTNSITARFQFVCGVILPWQKQPDMQQEMMGKYEGKPSCDAGDGVASEGDDSCKPAEWEVCRTLVINNYYVSPSKKEK